MSEEMDEPRRIAFSDQFFAATEHVNDLLSNDDEFAEAHWRKGSRLEQRVDQWRTLLSVGGLVLGCDHLINPQPAFAIMSFPKLIWCAPCYHVVFRFWTEIHPLDCDACGQESTTGFYEVNSTIGPLIIVGNICLDCRTEATGRKETL